MMKLVRREGGVDVGPPPEEAPVDVLHDDAIDGVPEEGGGDAGVDAAAAEDEEGLFLLLLGRQPPRGREVEFPLESVFALLGPVDEELPEGDVDRAVEAAHGELIPVADVEERDRFV